MRVDFGAKKLNENDDYTDSVLLLAKVVSNETVQRSISICGSGIGPWSIAIKVPGVRTSLIQDIYSAHQGVEDDNMNLICRGGRAVALELTRAFLSAKFSNTQRTKRRLSKISYAEGTLKK